MKTRICILTVSALAAISAPLAGAAIPADSNCGNGNTSRHSLVIKPTGKNVKKHGGTTSKTGLYNPFAYVPGGSSPVVSKQIQAQGLR